MTSLASMAQQNVAKEYTPQNDSIKVGEYVIKVVAVANGFGYDIYNKHKLFIHQTSVPALPGNNGFATKTAAERVARKVVEKMQKGETLPTITIDEMKQLGAIPKSQH